MEVPQEHANPSQTSRAEETPGTNAGSVHTKALKAEGATMDTFLEHLASEAVDAAMKLHIRVGPGLLEAVYETLLADELRRRGLSLERQKRVPIELEGHRFSRALRLDMLVEGQLPIEVKSVDVLLDTHWKQLLTYLRLMDLRLGLLINFGEARLKDGLKRVVNRYDGFGP